jgi:CheY-like chemotaxis protein
MNARSAVIIDDEPDITSYLSTLLSDNGWEARAANSVNEGLTLVRAVKPGVVLLDLMMPEKGGLNVLVAIRKDPALRDTPVVIVSGIQEKLNADYHAYLDRFKHYRANAFVDKPVDAPALLKTLDELVHAPA